MVEIFAAACILGLIAGAVAIFPEMLVCLEEDEMGRRKPLPAEEGCEDS